MSHPAQVSLLYRSEAQHMLPVSAGASKYSLQVADSLPSIGIMQGMTTGGSLAALNLPFSHTLVPLLLNRDARCPCRMRGRSLEGTGPSLCAGPVTRDEGAGLAARGPPALVAAVGHNNAGALAVLQQSIVPELVTETPVAGLHALLLHPPWAVSACSQSAASEYLERVTLHACDLPGAESQKLSSEYAQGCSWQDRRGRANSGRYSSRGC